MSILFTVCGRAGSKGVINKNVRNFIDCPLAYYTLAAIWKYQKEHCDGEQVYVMLNTDSADLIRVVRNQTVLPVSVIERDATLAEDSVPKVAVVMDCLDKGENKFNMIFDMVVDLDITSPLRTVNNMAAAIDKKRNRPDVDVVFSVTDSRRNPYFSMVRPEGDYFVPVIPSVFTARQQAPDIYDMNGSIYAYAPHALRQKSPIGFFRERSSVIFMMDTAVLDIDNENDLEMMQVVAGYLFDKYPEFGDIRSAALEMARSATKEYRS
jgi:CMP-N,N'-diacetyllegionaminic acid synthase